MRDEEEKVSASEAAGAGGKILGYLILMLVAILAATGFLGAVISPLVP